MRSKLFPAFALTALAAAATFACNAIIGLDTFDKVAAEAGLDASFDAADSSDASDASLGDVGTPPAKWAHFVMPNPDFDSGYDGAVMHTERWTTNGGIAKENVSGLTWFLTALPATSEAEAESRCASITDAGVAWRVPTRVELASLLDFSRPNFQPALINTQGISRVWSSSASQTKQGAYWTLAFDPTETMMTSGPAAGGVLCVAAQ